MSITTLVVIFSAPIPKSPGGLEHLTGNRKTQVQSLARTQIFFLYSCVGVLNVYMKLATVHV